MPVLLVVSLWDLGRNGGFELLASQMTSYGGLRLVWSWELWPRLREWGEMWSYVLGSPIAAFGLLLAVPPFLALLIHEQDRETALDQLFLLFLVAYFVLHWFLAVPVWDRYVLPAVPVAAVIVGRFASRLAGFVQPFLLPLDDLVARHWPAGRWFGPAALLLGTVAVLLPAAVQARLGHLPVGGQPGADQGAAEIAEVLANAPYGTVLYDHWFSWQWRYHLFDRRVYVSWFPHPAVLAEDLTAFGRNGQPRYLVVPESVDARPVKRAVMTAGFDLQPIYSSFLPDGRPGMSLYQIVRR